MTLEEITQSVSALVAGVCKGNQTFVLIISEDYHQMISTNVEHKEDCISLLKGIADGLIDANPEHRYVKR